jgi:hypothetical protein
MATETKLGAKVTELLKAMSDQKAIAPEQLWKWENMRTLHWLFIRRVILPEMGVNPADPNLKEEITAAWKAYCEFADAGYMFESSNAGSKFAEKGYCAKRATAAKVSVETPPE